MTKKVTNKVNKKVIKKVKKKAKKVNKGRSGPIEDLLADVIGLKNSKKAAATLGRAAGARKRGEVDIAKAMSVVGRTALMVAAERALETERGPDALFQDPFARELGGPEGVAMSDTFEKSAARVGFKGWPKFHKTWSAVRTRFVDDALTEAVESMAKAAKDGKLQLVNLGAGVDTRPYRLKCYRAFRTSFEVDRPEVNALKTAIFKRLGATPHCPVVTVAADLREPGALSAALKAAGFDPRSPALFLVEGLLDYLQGSVEGFLQEISQLAAAGSSAVVNFRDTSPEPLAPGQFTASALTTFLTGQGWTGCEAHAFGGERLNFGRYPAGREPCRQWSFMLCEKANKKVNKKANKKVEKPTGKKVDKVEKKVAQKIVKRGTRRRSRR